MQALKILAHIYAGFLRVMLSVHGQTVFSKEDTTRVLRSFKQLFASQVGVWIASAGETQQCKSHKQSTESGARGGGRAGR